MERLSDLDAAFLWGETPTQHLHVLATLVLEQPEGPGGAYKLFQERIRERFHLIEPLRRRPRGLGPGRAIWVDDADIHLERHLHHVIIDAPGGLDALARLAGDVAAQPLPRDRPLWEAWCVEGLESGEFAVLAKIHHSAADGVSGIGALAAFFDLDPQASAPLIGVTPDPTPMPTPAEMGRAMVDEWRRWPASFRDSLGRVARSALAMSRSDGDAPAPLSGPRLSFNRALTGRRSVAFTRVGLDEIKNLRRAYDVTINDVVIGLVTGVLRTRLLQGDELPDRPLVAAVPTSEREAEHGLVGNRVSFMFYALPVHLDDPAERLLAVQRSATAAKDLYSRSGVGLMASVASLAPPGSVGPAVRAFSRLRLANALPPIANVIVSNIRGPGFPLYVAGSRLQSLFPMGPLMEGIGLGVTVVSYRDEIDFGFIACPDLLPDVQALADGVRTEVARLTEAARQVEA